MECPCDPSPGRHARRPASNGVLPQLRGQKGQPREWVYSWYSPRQLPNTSMAVRECAFNARYKLYRTGEFFDLSNDVEEKTPMNVAALTGEAAAAAKLLQVALDRYHKVRPVELDRMFEREIKKDDSLFEEGKLFDASGAWKADLRVDTIEAPEGGAPGDRSPARPAGRPRAHARGRAMVEAALTDFRAGSRWCCNANLAERFLRDGR